MADKPRDPAVSIWVAPPKDRKRGSAPVGLTRDRIVRTAVELLDAEGVAAFSMRKLAAGLDVTPMSVYWYVDNKDQLLELALDAALGDIRIEPPVEHGDWRHHLRSLAHEYRRCFQLHPWAGQLAGQFLAVGPNGMRFSTSALSAVTGSGLPEELVGGALGLVFSFVYGFATAEAQWRQRVRASGLSEDELNSVIQGVVERVDAGFAAQVEAMKLAENGLAAARDRQFAQGLDLALAGIEATIAGS